MPDWVESYRSLEGHVNEDMRLAPAYAKALPRSGEVTTDVLRAGHAMD